MKKLLHPRFSATAVANLALGITIAAAGISPSGVFRHREEERSGENPAQPLRVIVRSEPMSFLPRNADPMSFDRELAAGLAEYLGRELVLVKVADHSQWIDRLLRGEGDLIAANMAATPEREKQVAFSTPYAYVDELLILPRHAPLPIRLEDLAGLTVSVHASSPHTRTLERIRKRAGGPRIEHVPETWTVEEIAAKVGAGELQATVVDSRIWEAIAGNHPELHAARVLSEDLPISIAMRPEDEALRRNVNEYLFSQAFTGPRDRVRHDDLEGILARGRLRMITRNDPICYFLHRGTELGFEYEMMSRFAKQLGVRLEVVIPPKNSDLVPWLLQGRGDVVAATMAISPEHGEDVMFTRPYETARQVVVIADGEEPVESPDDLIGETIYVHESSPHFGLLKSLQESYPGIRIALAPEDLEMEDILECVEAGTWDAAICNSVHLKVERAYGRKLRAAFSLRDENIGWVVRRSNPRLLQALNDFLETERRSAVTNSLRRRYFNNPAAVARARGAWRSDVSGRISPYDVLAKKHAARYDLDWRLLVAMMQEESSFDATQVSFMGAVGLMQLLPATAQELGIENPHNPESSIAGGAKYLRQLIEEFDLKLPLATRVRFALASYNVGRAHVIDARQLASKMGWRSDRWFGHVERAMLLLEQPEYAAQAKYGYCRGSECVHYVQDVEQRYRTFLDRVPGAQWMGPEESGG
jgi:membrane-bound lytic murein transglycosylase F